ncbi:hypothetical protein AB0I68_09160 [Streptomyces sp. NPDC050448]|uniref:hypothetical protein n=1 Tax=Streptomyces sp. NPDC050448 TaxID=3155404 RepID=UPI003443A94F
MHRTTLSLSERIAGAAALLAGKRTVRCPHPGCGVRIRYSHTTPEEATRLTALATDHTRH